MIIRKTKEQFIIDSTNIHGDKYNYTLVEYKNNKIKVKIICPVHGVFDQRPNDHLKGHGCSKCNGGVSHNTDIFTKKSNKIHHNYYNYSLVNYTKNKIKVKIICPVHGVFEQRPNDHLKGHGCPSCVGLKKSNTNDFITKSVKIHNNKYDYSLVEYINNYTKVKIICPIHGVFQQIPNNHLRNTGCPNCYKSKGEIKIKQYLDKNDIEYQTQKIFDNCIYKRNLKFDFYLPKYNICIEYDGEQHTKQYRFEKNDEKLKLRIVKDKIKTDYCLNNNIELIRVRYDENIENILKNKIPI